MQKEEEEEEKPGGECLLLSGTIFSLFSFDFFDFQGSSFLSSRLVLSSFVSK